MVVFQLLPPLSPRAKDEDHTTATMKNAQTDNSQTFMRWREQESFWKPVTYVPQGPCECFLLGTKSLLGKIVICFILSEGTLFKKYHPIKVALTKKSNNKICKKCLYAFKRFITSLYVQQKSISCDCLFHKNTENSRGKFLFQKIQDHPIKFSFYLF